MSLFRRLSARGLAFLLGAIAVVGAVSSVVAMTAFGGSGTTPPPEPLSQAIHDAVSADPIAGVTARIKFTNHLLGSSALGSLAGAAGSPLLSGASGRLWVTADGHLRLELPARTSSATDQNVPPSVAEIDAALAQLGAVADLSAATPDSVAGQPAYTVRVSPKANGGLVGAVELSWDAATGVPLHAAIYTKGDPSPVLDLTATDIAIGPVPASDVNVSPPPSAKIVPVTLPTTGTADASGAPVTGLAAVTAALPFTLVAPDSLNGLARKEVRLIGTSTDPGALVTYGEGLGTIAVSEQAASTAASSPLASLPSVSINGFPGHELVTALGSVVQVTKGGVSFTVAGSMTQADAEAAAQALTA
jgi:hypothetical protein